MCGNLSIRFKWQGILAITPSRNQSANRAPRSNANCAVFVASRDSASEIYLSGAPIQKDLVLRTILFKRPAVKVSLGMGKVALCEIVLEELPACMARHVQKSGVRTCFCCRGCNRTEDIYMNLRCLSSKNSRAHGN